MQATPKGPGESHENLNILLNLPPPDRAVMMQSPPPSEAPNDETFEEDAPCKEGPIDFMPETVSSEGKIIFKPKYFKAPTIIIESYE